MVTYTDFSEVRGMASSTVLVCASTLLLMMGGIVEATSGYDSDFTCPAYFFNFGDSITDTGTILNAFPFVINAENSPYGQNFFGQVAKRATNGRVIPDYFALAFTKPLLQPYIQAGAFDYTSGANFAVFGSTAANDTTQTPLFLAFQIGQFLRFKKSSTESRNQGACAPSLFFLPPSNAYGNALYTINIGSNDILNAANNSLAQGIFEPAEIAAIIVNRVIPAAIRAIVDAIQQIYNNSGRRFLVFHLSRLGCAPIAVTLSEPLRSLYPLDNFGCVIAFNQLSQGFNAALDAALEPLRNRPQISIAVFKFFDAVTQIYTNPTLYGFDPTKLTTACCGAPGIAPNNYNPAKPCGRAGSSACSNPDKYINWDGIHFTESTYRELAKFALNGEFTDFGTNYTENCDLSFRRFPFGVTFSQAYPATCRVTFTS